MSVINLFIVKVLSAELKKTASLFKTDNNSQKLF